MKRKGQAEMVDSSFLEDAACSAKSKKFSPFPESKDAVLKPVKLTQRELYKPPTTEEVNRLQETENLFHSSLLRMQIEELLKEVILSEEKRKKIDLFVQEVTTLLSSVPETNFTEIADQSWLPPGIKVPLLQIPFTVKGRFRMAPPCSLNVVGSYPLGTCTKPDINVDLAVTMPPVSIIAIKMHSPAAMPPFHTKHFLSLIHSKLDTQF
ncbi:nucleolar protein 6-like [Erpetoichthys calabaricus]|uniref:nucleolar protein 6-like n=1 Tax=Erpetoichthys calabaricus TaxID=27687 RepID=UPI002233FE42|nr:nucleolar protein 6-like [Erpetoichthys calabaricus]